MLLSTFFPIISFNITALQGIIVFFILLSSLILGILLTKRKPSKKDFITSIIVGTLVSLLTTMIGTGSSYKFGWPLYFLTFSEYEPETFRIVFERLILNTSFFILPILNISWFFSLRKTIKSLKIHILPLLTLFALLVLSIFCLVNVYEKSISGFSSLKLADDDTEQKLEAKGRYLVETKYPLFKDYEKQTSFAGKEVVTKIIGKKIYFAYAENGSGVRYVDATCFSVDDTDIVTIVGKLTKSSPSVFENIDPATCKEDAIVITPNSN